MKVKLVKIGNSTGVRLPKAVLTECGFSQEAELSVQDRQIILTPLSDARFMWRQAIQEEAALCPVSDEGEWQW